MEIKEAKEWEVQTYKTSKGFAIYSKDRCIAERWQDNISQEEHNNIAHLIAAAPDLLEFALSFSRLLANGDIELMKAKKGSEKELGDMVRLNIKAIEKVFKN